MSEPKVGDLEAWCIWFQFPYGKMSVREPVNTPQEGYDWIQKTANRQLEATNIEWSVFGLEVYAEDGWEEWYDEEGRDVDEALETADEGDTQ